MMMSILYGIYLQGCRKTWHATQQKQKDSLIIDGLIQEINDILTQSSLLGITVIFVCFLW